MDGARKGQILIAGGIGLIGVVTLILIGQRTAPDPTLKTAGLRQNEGETQRITSLERQVGTLSDNLNALIAWINEKESSGSGSEEVTNEGAHTDITTPTPNEQPVQSPARDLAAQDAEEQSHFAQIEKNFYDQSVDPGWSAKQEQDIRQVLASTEGLNRATLNGLECRSQSCRMDMGHQTADQADSDLDTLMRSFPNSSGEFKLEPQADGSVRTIVIMNKD